MTMAVWNVERWAAAVAAGQKRLLLWSIHWDINFYPQVEERTAVARDVPYNNVN